MSGPSTRVATLLAAALAARGCGIVDYEWRRWISMPGQRDWAPGVAVAAGMHDIWIDFVSTHPEQADQLTLNRAAGVVQQ